jgi:hypothetical protein
VAYGLALDVPSVVLPPLWATCLIGIALAISAAIEVRREELAQWKSYAPLVIHPDNRQPRPSLKPVMAVAGTLVLFLLVVLLFTAVWLPLKHGNRLRPQRLRMTTRWR